MISLTELLREIDEENKDGIVAIDSWRWPDVDYLISMGFDFADDHRFHTTKEPKITIYKKSDTDDSDGNPDEYFYVEEPGRSIKRFKRFNDLVDFFDSYEQPELSKNMALP